MNDFSCLLNNRSDAVSFMKEQIKHICSKIGKRAPGSAGEKEAAEYMADVLKECCGCSKVTVESFKEHPSAFWGYFYFSATFDCLCAVCFFILPSLSILFGVLALLLFLFQFVMYRPIIDSLFPERESINVTAVRPCSGEVKQRIFLNGHIDAAWEFSLNYRFGGIIFETPGVMAVAGVIYYIVLSIISILSSPAWSRTAGLIGLIFIIGPGRRLPPL